MADKKKSARALIWGAVRSETIADDDGRLVLQTAESEDIETLVEQATAFIMQYMQRFELEDDEIRTVLLQDAFLLGYVQGGCAAAAGPASDTGLTGFTTRVCGELLGGGMDNKIAVFERLRALAEDDDFLKGFATAVEDWKQLHQSA